MAVYFIPADQVRDGHVTVSGPLVHHLHASLRTRPGECLWVGTERRERYLVRVTHIDRRQLIGDIVETRHAGAPHTSEVRLVQAVLKGEKMDWLVQKAAELGVRTIIPVLSRRTIARATGARARLQQERWQRIAREAAQQAECWDVPAVGQVQPLDDWLSAPPSRGRRLILCERHEGPSLHALALRSEAGSEVTLLVGPEGGWEPEEMEAARTRGFECVTLGERILRAETAALVGLSLLQSRLGNLG